MNIQRNSTKVALAATLMGSLLLVACGGDSSSDNAANPTSVPATATPTTAPTVAPTVVPTAEPTVAPTVAPTAEPTAAPTAEPTTAPVVATSPFAASALDANGFYWFNATNDTLSLGYLVGEGDADASGNRSLDSAAAENSGEFISVYANALSTVTSPVYNASLTPGNATVTSSKTGTITISKASAALAVDGGYVVFKLPKVSAMHISHFTTGTPYFSVETSADDGATWTSKLAMVKAQSKSGEYTADLSSYVTSTSKVWVRIRNGGTGGFNLQGVKIVY